MSEQIACRSSGGASAIDPSRYRQVLGQYPTGVCVITARMADGSAAAMVVGSFSSVSLDPPLVAFFPDRKSSSWARLRECDRFCVNILSSDQEGVCRRLASKDPDKFAGIAHRSSTHGAPIIEGAVAWIECLREAVTDAGDHEMVTGRVLDLDVSAGGLPLLFFRGGYGRFAPASMAADERDGISLAQLGAVDRARPAMERLAEQVGGVCIATVRVEDGLVIAASAGQPRPGGAATLVGQHLPFAPPTGSVFAAWLPERERAAWMTKSEGAEQALHSVQSRGFSVGLRTEAQRTLSERLAAAAIDHGHHADVEDLMAELSFDPPELSLELCQKIRLVSAPVFNRVGDVVFALTIHNFGKPVAAGGIRSYIDALIGVTGSLSARTHASSM